MMRYVTLCAVLFLASCATTEKYEAMLNTWVGQQESQLVGHWGPPDSVYENSGVKYLTYKKSRSGYIPGTPPTYQTNIIGNTAYTTSTGGSPGFAYTNHCKTTFTISNEIIQKWRWEGNACRAR